MSKLEEFEIFWKSLVGRKVNKKKAKEVYLKIKTNLSPQELSKRFNILYRKTGEEKYVPHPERWLRNERWNDEINEYDDGEKVYRDNEGFIISKEEWEEINKQN